MRSYLSIRMRATARVPVRSIPEPPSDDGEEDYVMTALSVRTTGSRIPTSGDYLREYAARLRAIRPPRIKGDILAKHAVKRIKKTLRDIEDMTRGFK